MISSILFLFLLLVTINFCDIIFLVLKDRKKQESHRPKFDSCFPQHMWQKPPCDNDNEIMITISDKNFKSISQKNYNEIICSVKYDKLVCSCGNSACLKSHGYYTRSIKNGAEKESLRICRVKCSVCDSTHALLLSTMIPYSQTSLIDQIAIIKAYVQNKSYDSVMDENAFIDENNIRYIIRQFIKFWRSKINPRFLFNSIDKLISYSFHNFNLQFMQIKDTDNILFTNTT